MSISEKIAAVRAAKTQAADYTGKKISELDDTVIGSAYALKKRFDAMVEDVIDPKHNALAEAAAQALEEINTGKAADGHTHALAGDDLTGALPITKGGTGADSAPAARAALDVYSQNEVKMTTNSAVSLHDSNGNAHADALAKKVHTHSLTDNQITGTLPLSKGGTGGSGAAAARMSLDVYSKTETASKVTEHNGSSSAHPGLFASKTHTHMKSDITDFPEEARTSWYATCAGGTSGTKTAATATGDFSPVEGGILVVKFTDTSLSSSISFKIDGGDVIDVINREGYEDGMIAAGAIAVYLIVKETSDGALKLLRISEELASSTNVGVVKAVGSVTASTGTYAVPTCAAVKAYAISQAEAAKETYTDSGNGDVVVRGTAAQTAKRFLNSLTFPGLGYEYRNPLHDGTYADPYGLKIGSGASLVDAINALTEPGLYTVYVNRAATDAPDEAKEISSSLRGIACLSQINKHYAWIILIDQASNFYIQYVQGDVGMGWKRLAAYDAIKAYVDGKLDGVEEALTAI